MKKLMIACLLLVLTSCAEPGKKVSVSDSVSDFDVEKLFDVDGISVYRFYDGTKPVYFTNRRGEVYTEKTYTNGKSTIKERTQTLCE